MDRFHYYAVAHIYMHNISVNTHQHLYRILFQETFQQTLAGVCVCGGGGVITIKESKHDTHTAQ